MGNVDDEQHNRCHRELSSSSLSVLFVSKEKKPKPNHNYESSLSLSVSTKSYELLIGKRTLTQKMNEFVKRNVCNLGALCWHLQSGVFLICCSSSPLGKKKKVFHCPHLSASSLV